MKLSALTTFVLCAISGMSAAQAAGAGGSVGGYAPVGQWAPAGIKAEPFVITPWLGVAYGTNSNVGLSNVAPQSSSMLVVNPNLSVVTEGDMQRYSANYTGSWGRFKSSSRDNYDDHAVGAEAENEWTGRLSTRVKADYTQGHDARNAFRLNASPERWKRPSVQGAVHYGAPQAQGQLEFEAGTASKRYSSNRLVTVDYDNDITNFAGKFKYKLGADTHLDFKALQNRITYQSLASAGRDSTEQGLLVGLSWDVTSKTSGSVLAGSTTKRFDTGLIGKRRGLTWEADMKWAPMTYSKISVSGGRNFAETMDVGNYLTSRNFGVSWNHDWSRGVETALTAQDATDTYSGLYRVDQRFNVGAKVSYAVQRWLRGGLEVQRQNRNSTTALYTYNRNIVMLTLEGSL